MADAFEPCNQIYTHSCPNHNPKTSKNFEAGKLVNHENF